ncbi:MAG TPA: IMP dehydrogenase [Armatimonadota bacterium]|nr:IMP dehydrogenase [Armatimonadota bacterium]
MPEGRFAREGLSFDDVLLVPDRADVLPTEVDTSTYFTRDIKLFIPLLSSPMDTVTGARMAIALAREGGIGVIHRNMTPEAQAAEVDKVKRSEHGIIVDPVFLSPTHTIKDALTIMERYHISGVPITDHGRLVGILTNRDIRFETEPGRPIHEVMTSQNLVTAPMGTTLNEAKELLQKHKVEKLPLVDSNRMLLGLVTIKDIEKARQFPNATKDANGRLRVAAAVGPMRGTMERVQLLAQAGVDAIVVDTAHGHSSNVINAIQRIRAEFPNLPLVAGNVATAQGAIDLVEAGADGIRVGMGPGSICTTRVIAGIGVPQLTAIADCADECKKVGATVIADGGIRRSGDITKAIAAGADTVMIGSLFAGTDESPGEIEIFRNRSFKVYRGMGSMGAMREGSSDRYFQSDEQQLVPEGIEGRVPYKGPLSEFVFQLAGGLRAGMGYCGCRNINELKTRTRFIRITSASLRESHPHDVWITKEAPNYSLDMPEGCES